MRNLNNWIKAVLIGEANLVIEQGWSSWAFQKSHALLGQYTPLDSNYPLKSINISAVSTNTEDAIIAHAVSVRSMKPLDVIDFGCGKGGDIGKWLKCSKGKR